VTGAPRRENETPPGPLVIDGMRLGGSAPCQGSGAPGAVLFPEAI
jgi:hypothetical protein